MNNCTTAWTGTYDIEAKDVASFKGRLDIDIV